MPIVVNLDVMMARRHKGAGELDEEHVKELLEEYDVSYIFVGSKEREKYGDALNEEVLNSLGEVVFQDEEYSTYILKVNK